MLIGELPKTSIHYVFHSRLGFWAKLFAKLHGHTPQDYHAWIVTDEVPALVRFEGPLFTSGPL